MDIRVGLFIASMNSDFPSIMIRASASCILLEKELDVIGSSMDTWKSR